MGAQYAAERLVEQMGCAVVIGRQGTVFFIHQKFRLIACFQHSLCHMTYMADLAAVKLDHILYLEFSLCSADHTFIGLLTTTGGIKRSLVYNDRACLSLSQRLHNLSLCSQNRDLRFTG